MNRELLIQVITQEQAIFERVDRLMQELEYAVFQEYLETISVFADCGLYAEECEEIADEFGVTVGMLVTWYDLA